MQTAIVMLYCQISTLVRNETLIFSCTATEKLTDLNKNFWELVSEEIVIVGIWNNLYEYNLFVNTPAVYWRWWACTEQVRCNGDCVDSSGSSAPSGSNVTTAVATDASAADYLERLKVLRARCGLDNDGNARTDSTLSDMAVNITKSCTSTLQVVDGSVSAVSALVYILLSLSLQWK